MKDFWAIYRRNKGSVIGLVILAMVLVLALTMPWLITMMVQYSQELITSIPENL